MKNKKINTAIIILISSLVLIVIIGIVSYFMSSKSQKLPAVVRSERLFVSAKTTGIVNKITAYLNQKVAAGQVLLKLENELLTIKIMNLKKEKTQLETLINSASEGDLLTLELEKINNDLYKYQDDLKRWELKKEELNNNLTIYKEKYNLSKIEYETYQELHQEKIITVSEFENKSSKFLEISNKYFEIKNDSIATSNEIETRKKNIRSLRNKKKMFMENVSLIADNHLIRLQELHSKLNELEKEAVELNITAPVSGIISEINCELGESVGKGKNLIEISTHENFRIIAYGNSFSRQKIKKGMMTAIFCSNGKKIRGKVETVSPIMKKVKAITPTFETANTYTEIKILFADPKEAKKNLTSGERLFVRIYF